MKGACANGHGSSRGRVGGSGDTHPATTQLHTVRTSWAGTSSSRWLIVTQRGAVPRAGHGARSRTHTHRGEVGLPLCATACAAPLPPPEPLNASYMGGIGCGGPLHFYPTPGVRCAALHNASQRIQRCYTSQRPAKHSKGVHSSALQPRRTKRAQRPAPPSTCCAPSLCLCLPTGTTPLWQCGSGALQLQCAVRCARERLLHTWHVVGLSHATTTSTAAVAHWGWLCRAACTL